MPNAPLATTIAIAILVYASFYDAREFIIPNWTSLALPCCLVAAWFEGTPCQWQSSAVAGISTFALTFLISLFFRFGGGDIKLLTACATMVNFERLPDLGFATMFAGGALVLAASLVRRFLPGRGPRAFACVETALCAPGGGIPYGIAIACGATLTLLDPTGITP